MPSLSALSSLSHSSTHNTNSSPSRQLQEPHLKLTQFHFYLNASRFQSSHQSSIHKLQPQVYEGRGSCFARKDRFKYMSRCIKASHIFFERVNSFQWHLSNSQRTTCIAASEFRWEFLAHRRKRQRKICWTRFAQNVWIIMPCGWEQSVYSTCVHVQ
jgi:hypothetical protein